MPSLHNTRTFESTQTKVLQKIYSNSTPQKPLRYPDIFNNYTGDEDRSFWQAMSITGFGTLAQKTEGQAATLDAAGEGPGSAFPWVSYALRYIVSKEAQMEDPKKLIPKLPGLLRYSSDQTKELLFWNVFNLAFLSAANGGYNLSVDGQPLISNAHTYGPANTPLGTFSNNLGAVALTPETLNAAYTLMASMPDDRGLLTYKTPQHLIFPLGLDMTAREVLQSTYYPYSNENRINAVQGSITPHPIEYLTANAQGPFPWFVLAGKGEIGQDAHTAFANIKFENQRSWVDPVTEAINHQTEFRAAWGVVNPRGIIGSQGA